MANMSILIGEQNLVKSHHLLQMRSVLVGNTLAMLSASSLALNIVPMPLMQVPVQWRRLAETQVGYLLLFHPMKQGKMRSYKIEAIQ